MQSPCHTCDYKDSDKNDPACVNCDLRVRYCVAQGMMAKEVLKPKQDDPLIMEARRAAPKKKRKLCKDCHRPKPIKARGRCTPCYARYRYHNADKVRGYRKKGL